MLRTIYSGGQNVNNKSNKAMYPDRDATGHISILEMTSAEAETLHTALMRILNDLPATEQTAFRRLLIQLEKLIG